jgi:transposase
MGILASTALCAHPLGRRGHDGNRRSARIRAVTLLVTEALDGAQVARAFQVSRATVYRWRDELMTDGEADTEGLRRLAAPSFRPQVAQV